MVSSLSILLLVVISHLLPNTLVPLSPFLELKTQTFPFLWLHDHVSAPINSIRSTCTVKVVNFQVQKNSIFPENKGVNTIKQKRPIS